METNPVSRDTAMRLDLVLRGVLSQLDEAAAVVNAECSAEFAKEAKLHIGHAMSYVCWDILERMVYARYPELRPYELDR